MAVETPSPDTLADKLSYVLDKGIVEPQCGPCCIDCGPIYAFANVETYLKLQEALGGTSLLGEVCCIESCLKELRIIIGEEAFEIFNDKGIVDHSSLDGGKSYLCEVLEQAKNNNASAQDVFDIVNVLLDEGIVIYCDGETKVTASVETFLKYAEAVGITCGAPPPVPARVSTSAVVTTNCIDIDGCCTNVVASVETYLKYAEAVGPGPGPVPL
jgi:hypothetical protein